MQTPDFSQMSRREIEDYLVERALVDASFRGRLLSEPEALLRDLGIPVGADVKVRVLEEEPKSFYLVLPRVLREAGELEETDLDHVAGGGNPPTEASLFFNGYDGS